MKVFITGGTTGIGLALAQAYLQDGHEVGVCGRDVSKLPAEARSHPKLKAYQLSVCDRQALLEAVRDFAPGGLDIMVANAGVSVGSKNRTPNFNDARSLIETNVIGVLNSFEAALETMLPRKQGHLVAVASVAGFVGLPGAGPYSASKAAVLKLCESWWLDLRRQGISVTAIAPGFIDTPLTRKNDHVMPFLMSSEEAAQRMKNAIAAKKARYTFPFRMRLLITFLELLPRVVYRTVMALPMFDYSKE